MAEQTLRITQDTVLKLRPEQASSLSPQELYDVTAGTTFAIQSYAYADVNGSFQGHIKFALKNTAIRGFNTWFVYGLHAQVEQDGQVVYPLEEQASLPILRINRNTILKRRPLPSSMLPASETYAIEAGQSFKLQSYAYADEQGDFSSHIKFAIRDRQDFIRGLSTWYVYDQHAYVEFDGDVVYPPEDPNILLMRVVVESTLFKRRPVQASQLADSEKYLAARGTLWKLHSYAYADAQGSFNGHVKFALRYEADYIQKLSTWYVYGQHIRIEQRGIVVYPRSTPSPTPSSYQGTPFRLPGNTTTFYTDQPIIPGGSFTWGEATKDATRIPTNVTIVNNIIALARELQKVRNQIGRPFIINSWYRPPDINDSVGGVSGSQHLYGKAVDVQVPGYSGRRLANAVMLSWPGGVGIYSTIPDIVHLDIGQKRTWGF